MILGLRMKNWKSHKETSIEFGKGTNLLVGQMGSGKSSTVDAISFALFGTFPALKNRRVKLEELIMERPEKQQVSEVSIRFESNGKIYNAMRSIGRKNSSEAQLFCNERLMEAQPARVNELIEEILGMDYELFSRIIYAEQNRIDQLLNVAKGERKRQVDELLGMDRYEAVRASAVSLGTKLKNRKAEIQNFLRGSEAENLEKELETSRTRMKECEEDEKRISEEKKKREEEAKKSGETLKELEKKEGEFSKLEKSIASFLAVIESRKKEWEKETKELGKELESAELEKTELETKKLRAEIEKMKEKQRNLKKLENEFSKINAELSVLEREMDEMNALKLESAETEKEALETIRKETEKLAKDAEETEKKLMKTAENIGRLENEEKEARKKLDERKRLEERMNALEKEYEEGIENALLNAKAGITTIQKGISETECAMDELKHAIESLSSESAACPVCDSQLEKKKKETLLSEKGKRLSEAEKTLGMENAKLEPAMKSLKVLETKSEESRLLKSKISELEDAEKILEECGKKLEQDRRMKSEAEKENVERKETLSTAQEKAKTQEERFGKAQKKQEMEKKLMELRKGEKTISATIEKEGKECSEEVIERKRKELEKSERIGRALKIREESENAEKALKKSEKEREVLNFRKEELDGARSVSIETQTGLATKTEEMKSTMRMKEEISKALANLERKHNATEEKRKLLANTEEKMAKIETYQRCIVETQSILRSQLIEAINLAMQDIWPSIYPYRDYKSLRLEALEDDYSLLVETSEGEFVGVENCSGGERSCAALALRIAFATVLAPKLSWLILDEPTHNLDSQAVALLNRALHDELPKLVEQTFVITHDEALKEGANAKVFYFERDKENGDRSVVEEISAS